MDNNLGNKQTLARNLKRLMEENGKSRTDICKALNIKYTTLTDWLNAKTYPRIDALQLLANYFRVSKADLVEEKYDFDRVFYLSQEEQVIIETWRRSPDHAKELAAYALGLSKLLKRKDDENEGKEADL